MTPSAWWMFVKVWQPRIKPVRSVEIMSAITESYLQAVILAKIFEYDFKSETGLFELHSSGSLPDSCNSIMDASERV